MECYLKEFYNIMLECINEFHMKSGDLANWSASVLCINLGMESVKDREVFTYV